MPRARANGVRPASQPATRQRFSPDARNCWNPHGVVVRALPCESALHGLRPARSRRLAAYVPRQELLVLTHCMNCGRSFAPSTLWQRIWQRFGSGAKVADHSRARRRASIKLFVLGHECHYTYWPCRYCGCYSIESYWDRWDDNDPVKHLGPFPAEVGDRCLELIAACPDPSDQDCQCDSHKALYYGTPRTPDDGGSASAKAGAEN